MGRNSEFSTKERNKIPQQVRNDKIRLSFLRMQESSVSGTVSETLDSTKKYPHFHGSRERNLHSYLRHLLAESLIFLRDILAR